MPHRKSKAGFPQVPQAVAVRRRVRLFGDRTVRASAVRNTNRHRCIGIRWRVAARLAYRRRTCPLSILGFQRRSSAHSCSLGAARWPSSPPSADPARRQQEHAAVCEPETGEPLGVPLLVGASESLGLPGGWDAVPARQRLIFEAPIEAGNSKPGMPGLVTSCHPISSPSAIQNTHSKPWIFGSSSLQPTPKHHVKRGLLGIKTPACSSARHGRPACRSR